MKKTILILILTLTLIAQTTYAEEASVAQEPAEAPPAMPAEAPLMPAEEADVLPKEEAPKNEGPTDAVMTTGFDMAAGAGPVPASPGDVLGGSITSFLNESFQTDLATGAATLTIPITVPPGRKNMQPVVALSYSSNNADGLLGVGWAIPESLIQRSTKKGAPKYDNTDTFIFASSGANAELLYIGNNEYRAKLEGAFMKYVFDGNSWTVYDKTGTKYVFGSADNSRLKDGAKVFAWYLDRVEDVYGNYITYIYEHLDGQIYPKEIKYTGFKDDPVLAPDKSVVFNYEQRTDKQYSYRSGWLVATTQRLRNIEVYLNNNIVWTYKLGYITSPDTARSLLEKITVYDKAGHSLPPKRFTYQRMD